jgi:hypothetical protein
MGEGEDVRVETLPDGTTRRVITRRTAVTQQVAGEDMAQMSGDEDVSVETLPDGSTRRVVTRRTTTQQVTGGGEMVMEQMAEGGEGEDVQIETLPDGSQRRVVTRRVTRTAVVQGEAPVMEQGGEGEAAAAPGSVSDDETEYEYVTESETEAASTMDEQDADDYDGPIENTIEQSDIVRKLTDPTAEVLSQAATALGSSEQVVVGVIGESIVDPHWQHPGASVSASSVAASAEAASASVTIEQVIRSKLSNNLMT